MTFSEKLKMLLEACESGRLSTESIMLVLIVEDELEQLAASAQVDEAELVCKVTALLKMVKAMLRHADSALQYGAEVVRSGSEVGAPTRDAHYRQYNTLSDQTIPLLAELRRLVGIPF